MYRNFFGFIAGDQDHGHQTLSTVGGESRESKGILFKSSMIIILPGDTSSHIHTIDIARSHT